jgi:uncharacterized protein YdcH (DUF465 family)
MQGQAMKAPPLSQLTVDQLVDRFKAVTLEQADAIVHDDNTRFNRLFEQMEAVKQELKGREGDQRRALLRLFDHPNTQVRLKAAKATLAVAPEAARRILETIANSHELHHAGEAGMTLANLDRGIFKPT